MSAFYAHVIQETDGKMLAQQRLGGAPAVGDEIRLPGERYYRVTRVIWCLDEHRPDSQRINVGVVPA